MSLVGSIVSNELSKCKLIKTNFFLNSRYVEIALHHKNSIYLLYVNLVDLHIDLAANVKVNYSVEC